jgi:protein SCO1/2
MNWKKKLFNTKLVMLLGLLFALSCQKSTFESSPSATLPYYGDPTFTPQWISPGSDSLQHLHRIRPFSLLDQEGDTITEATFAGKIYVTDFFFTICPGICPKMTANMGVLQEAFLDDDDVLLLSHSVTPSRDSVPVLKAYAEDKGVVSSKWHLVTGEQKEIYDLGRNAYFVEEDLGVDKEESAFLHTENFVLVDGSGFIRGIYNGLDKASIQQLIKDIRTLQVE